MTKFFYLIVLALSVQLIACDSGTQIPLAPAVVVEQAQSQDITQTSSYAGTIQTLYTVEILPRIEGYLQKRTFEEGQTVQNGDLLFVIEPDQYQATVLQKQADLASAEAILVERTLNVERMRALLDKKVVAQATKDQAESNYSTADANVKAAKAALVNAELNLGYTQIHAPMTGRIGLATVSPGDYIAPGMPALATIVQMDP
ncbi:MAG TPA: efflux RND transporter periplasmic adaptor subunit, partial [Gammaproteobacteria bacterium]|nr:efflux RND transporter periplasmic adaptor subunit [Gammaproteobacteria bacterium]